MQRFREGFTRLPPAGRFGELGRVHPANARRAAGVVGWLMAAELRAVGVDFSFAPVLDLNRGVSRVIGDRAFIGSGELLFGARFEIQGIAHAGGGAAAEGACASASSAPAAAATAFSTAPTPAHRMSRSGFISMKTMMALLSVT